MSEALDRLAAMVGIEPSYLALTGEIIDVSDDAKRATLARDGDRRRRRGRDRRLARRADADRPRRHGGAGGRRLLRAGLAEGTAAPGASAASSTASARSATGGSATSRTWRASPRSPRRPAPTSSASIRCTRSSPPRRSARAPSRPRTRQFLNPLYIAVDKAPGFAGMEDALVAPEELRTAELVDYAHVGASKLKALVILFRIFQAHAPKRADTRGLRALRRQRRARRSICTRFSRRCRRRWCRQGNGPTWHGWPDEYAHPGTDAVRAFAEEQSELVAFHTLAAMARRQAARRGAGAGARGGPADRPLSRPRRRRFARRLGHLVRPRSRRADRADRRAARLFQRAGQDWGLAPLSPAGAGRRGFRALSRVDRRGAAPRRRAPHRPRDEPLPALLDRRRLFRRRRRLCALSLPRHAEDARPRCRRRATRSSSAKTSASCRHGFREVMQKTEIQSYRVFFFEKRDDHLPAADDLSARGARLPHHARPPHARRLVERARHRGAPQDRHDRRRRPCRASARSARICAAALLGLLAGEGLLPEGDGSRDARRGGGARGDAGEPRRRAASSLVARAPSRLFVVQAEDLTGALDQVNIPGTVGEHPNWRRKLAVDLEELPDAPLFRAITEALRERAAEAGLAPSLPHQSVRSVAELSRNGQP